MIEATCFGRSEIVTPTGRILPTSELVFAVALYLCVRAGERVSRGELAETFWPHSDEVKGRHSLRQMLYRLKELGFTLDEDGELLSLSPFRVRCDLADALREDWIIEADEATIAAACDALPGFTRRFSERYGEWIDGVRARLESQFRRAALLVLEDAKREGRWFDVERWALMLLRSDPLNETAVLARAEGTVMLGSKAEAIAQLDRYLDELGPNAERIGLPAKVLRRRIKDSGERQPGEEVLPLVGREDVMRRMTANLYSAKEGHGQSIFLTGVAGIGKSRIMSEISKVAMLLGFSRISMSPTWRPNGDSEASLAMSLARTLFALPGALSISPAALGIAKRLSGMSDTDTPTPQDLNGYDLTSQSILWSLSELLQATSAEQPLFLCIDDVHTFSLEACTLIASLVKATTHSRVVWGIAGRTIQPVFETLRTGHLTHLPHLTEQSCKTLARLACAHIASDDTHIVHLARHSGGNPFFLLTLAKAHHLNGARGVLPESIRDSLDSRLRDMSETEREILQYIACLGPFITVSRLSHLTSLQAHSLGKHLEHLDGYHGTFCYVPDKLLRLHDLWYEAIIRFSNVHTYALRCHHVAELLNGEGETTDEDLLAWQGYLFTTAGDLPRAQKAYECAGDIAENRGLSAAALKHFYKAAELTSPHQLSIALAAKITTQLLRLQKPKEAAETASTALLRGSENGPSDIPSLTLLHALRADAYFKLGQPFTADTHATSLLLRSYPITSEQQAFSLLIGMRLSIASGESNHSALFWRIACDSQWTDNTCLPILLSQLVFGSEQGDPEATDKAIATCAAYSYAYANPHWRTISHRYIAMAQRWLGRITESESSAKLSLTIATQMGFAEDAFSAAIQTANMFLDHGDFERALQWLQHAQAIPPDVLSQERRRALLFTKARLYLLSNSFSEALQEYQAIESAPRDDVLKPRAIVDLACIGLAHLGLKNSLKAIEACSQIIEALSTLRMSQQFDFALNAALTILCQHPHAELSRSLSAICNRRLAMQATYIPTAFHELRGVLGTSTTQPT